MRVSVMVLSCGDSVQPAAEADQRAGGPVDVPDAVQQPAPAAQRPGVGQVGDGLLHQRAQPRLQAVERPLRVAEPVLGAAVPDRGVPVPAALGQPAEPAVQQGGDLDAVEQLAKPCQLDELVLVAAARPAAVQPQQVAVDGRQRQALGGVGVALEVVQDLLVGPPSGSLHPGRQPVHHDRLAGCGHLPKPVAQVLEGGDEDPVGLAVPQAGQRAEQQVQAVADLGLGDPDRPAGAPVRQPVQQHRGDRVQADLQRQWRGAAPSRRARASMARIISEVIGSNGPSSGAISQASMSRSAVSWSRCRRYCALALWIRWKARRSTWGSGSSGICSASRSALDGCSSSTSSPTCCSATSPGPKLNPRYKRSSPSRSAAYSLRSRSRACSLPFLALAAANAPKSWRFPQMTSCSGGASLPGTMRLPADSLISITLPMSPCASNSCCMTRAPAATSNASSACSAAWIERSAATQPSSSSPYCHSRAAARLYDLASTCQATRRAAVASPAFRAACRAPWIKSGRIQMTALMLLACVLRISPASCTCRSSSAAGRGGRSSAGSAPWMPS